MSDSDPQKTAHVKAYWFTQHFKGIHLYEYTSLDNFKNDIDPRLYELNNTHQFQGTGHAMYRGSFYYHILASSKIARFDLEKQEIVSDVTLPDAANSGMDYLYANEYDYFDIEVDENGLWVIYGSYSHEQTLYVAQLNPETLVINKIWPISVDHRSYGNGFITCGILYLVKSTRVKRTFINFAYDLYKDEPLKVLLPFTNPFQMTTMLSYNYREKALFSWDRGSQLKFPIKIMNSVR